jgi:hypothetical protein
MAINPKVFMAAPWTDEGGGAGTPFLPIAQQGPSVFANSPEGSAAAPGLKPIAMPSAAPPVFASGPAPQVSRTPTPIEQQIGETDQRLRKLQDKDARPFGFAGDPSRNLAPNHPGVGGKILHALSVAGNIAGDIFAPSTMELIPGTQLNRRDQEASLGKRLQLLTQASTDNQQKEAQTEQEKALTEYTRQRPAIEQSKLDQKRLSAQNRITSDAAKRGQLATFDEDGFPAFADDPTSEAFQSRKVLDDVRQSKQDLQDAQTAYTNAKHNPNDPLFQQVERRLAIAQQNANAAGTRAQAYMGNYLKGAFNKDLSGHDLAGAPRIADDNGNVVTVGATNAGFATKANAGAAQFNDVHGALDSLESTAGDVVRSGGRLNSPGISYAMQHMTGTPTQFIQSLDKASLSPEERAYVISVAAAHENIQGLRKSAGGGATDTQVGNLLKMLPDASTPDLDYLKGQTGQIRATADRLGRGAATAAGGLHVRGQEHDLHKETAPAAPKVGDVRPGNDGNYRFKGGDQYDQKNWEKVGK